MSPLTQKDDASHRVSGFGVPQLPLDGRSAARSAVVKGLVLCSLAFAACVPASQRFENLQDRPDTVVIESARLRWALDEHAAGWLAESEVPSIAIAYISDGEVQWTSTYGEQSDGVPASSRTLYNVASLAKPISAEVVLRLVSRGRLSLDEPLSNHWIDPDVQSDARHRHLTLRLALSHRTGFPNWRYSTGNVLRFDSDPGAQLSYSGEGYEYARRFTERKLATPWESLASQAVLSPVGMANTSYTVREWFVDRIAIPFGSQGRFLEPSVQTVPNAADDLYTTIGDYARFVVSVMNREGISPGVADQRDSIHVLNQRVIDDCDSSRVSRCPVRGGMGLGWEILDFPDERVLLHTGGDQGEQTMAFYFPASRKGAVMFTNGSNGFRVILDAIDLLFHGTDFASFALSKR